jgi:hypothetical protein
MGVVPWKAIAQRAMTRPAPGLDTSGVSEISFVTKCS